MTTPPKTPPGSPGRHAAERQALPVEDSPSADGADGRDSPGRVVFDRRGHPVWEWNTEGGDSTSVLLRKLDNDDLALEPTRRAPALGQKAGAAKAGPPAKRGLELEDDVARGFNPYDRS